MQWIMEINNMWQLIAKGIAGGIGGGLKAAGETSKTNTSGEFQEVGQNSEADTASGVGGLLGKAVKKLKGKKSDNEDAKTEKKAESEQTPFQKVKSTKLDNKPTAASEADKIDFAKREAEFKKRKGEI